MDNSINDRYSIVVRPTLLYINFRNVIPAKAGIQLKTLDSGSSPE
jgi:hypothetical protein